MEISFNSISSQTTGPISKQFQVLVALYHNNSTHNETISYDFHSSIYAVPKGYLMKG